MVEHRSEASLTFEPDRALGFSLHLPFHQQEWDNPPTKRCPIHPLPAQQGQSPEEQPHLTDPPRCRGSCQAPPVKKPPALQKPLPLLCLLLCPFPPVPNYHPVELHSCRDPRPQPCAPQGSAQPHTAGVNGAAGSLRRFSSCSAEGSAPGGAPPSVPAFAGATY